MNTDEIVMALRCCNSPKGHRCSRCPVFSRYEHGVCKATVDRFAVDLIESLQAQHKQAALNYQQKCRDVVELEAQLAASQRRAQDARNELCQKCGQYREAHNGACDGCKWHKEDTANDK